METKNTYNVAFNYLCTKYGKKYLGLTVDAQIKLRFKTKKQIKEIQDNYVDSDFIITYNDPTEHGDIEISLLLKQYYLSESVKSELENKLLELGIISE